MTRRTTLRILLACAQLRAQEINRRLHHNRRAGPDQTHAQGLRDNLAQYREAEQWLLATLAGKTPGEVDDELVGLLAGLVIGENDAHRSLVDWCADFAQGKVATVTAFTRHTPIVAWLKLLAG